MKTIYIFVRNDIPKNRQIAQACHAGMLSSPLYPDVDQNDCRVIVLAVKNTNELFFADCMSAKAGIVTHMFHEPDCAYNGKEYGYTALATAPIDPDKCSIFSNFNLWQAVDRPKTMFDKLKSVIKEIRDV